MNEYQEITPSPEFDKKILQSTMDRWGISWGKRHSNDRKKAGIAIEVLEPDLKKHPEQSIDCSLVPVNPEFLVLPEEAILAGLKQNLAAVFGSEDRTNEFVDDIISAPTSSENPVPLIESVRHAQENSENVGLLFGHAVLTDIGSGLAGFTLAMGDKAQLERNVVLMNAAMSYEAIPHLNNNGRLRESIVKLTSSFCNVIRVVPKTKTARLLETPKAMSDYVNMNAGRALRPFTNRGALIALALNGTGVEYHKTGLRNNKTLESITIPKMDYSSARLTEKLDYTICVPMWQDPKTGEMKWVIGALENVPKATKLQRKNQEIRRLFNCSVADTLQLELARGLEQLSGIKIRYERLVPQQPLGNLALENAGITSP